MSASTLAILAIYLGFALLELWRSNLFAKPEQTRDDGIVEAVSIIALLGLTQPAILSLPLPSPSWSRRNMQGRWPG